MCPIFMLSSSSVRSRVAQLTRATIGICNQILSVYFLDYVLTQMDVRHAPPNRPCAL